VSPKWFKPEDTGRKQQRREVPMLQSTQKYSGSRVSTSVRHLDGRRLAYALRGKSAATRARFAATCDEHGVVIYYPTQGQLAALFRVPPYRLARARNGNGNGNAKHGNGQANAHRETLAQVMERTTPAEWQSAALTYGVDRIWDQMIAPIIAEETAVAKASP
jgi:hypothetical protein